MSSSSPFPPLTPDSQDMHVEGLPTIIRPRHRRRTLSWASVSSTQSGISLDLLKPEPTTLAASQTSRDAYGCFVPATSARASLQHLSRATSSEYTWSFHWHRRPSYHMWDEDNDSPLSSSPSSPTGPFLSITVSSSSIPDHDHLGLESSMTPHRFDLRHDRRVGNELNPILAKLERRSKLLTQTVHCVTCNKRGSDFPKCGRCGAVWCSRECRMYGGKRHTCTQRV